MKQLLVSSEVQVAILKLVILEELKTGFWKDHRPAGHGAQWDDVSITVSTSEELGPKDFILPRLYNFVNPDFIKPNEQRLVAAAQTIKPNSTFKSVKKELIELSRIVGGRLTSKSMSPLKANRGNNKDASAIVTAKADVNAAIEGVKRTVVKKPVEIIKTSAGATVRRVPVSTGE